MTSKRLKVLTILGTRPEIIRLARVIDALDRFTDHILVHTGQNYDYELNQIFFDELRIRKPDRFLGIDTSSIGAVLGGILMAIEPVLLEEQPDAVLILGDTNSAIAGIMARRMNIPLYHMEAGNRCFDMNVPEETNRKIVDHISDFNLVYTEHARRHLLSEGIPHRSIYLTGSPMREVLEYYRDQIDRSDILEQLDLTPRKYLLVSMHRAENVDRPDKLRQLLDALEQLAQRYGYPLIVSTHPRTRKQIDQLGYQDTSGQLRFLKPFGFADYNQLQLNSFCTVSDSGTISEESAILGFPAVTIRNAIERPEALDNGSITMCGTDPDRILDCVDAVTQQREIGPAPVCPEAYQIRDTSQRVVRFILGTARLAHRWQGIESVRQSECRDDRQPSSL